ncbi:hypothetical protein [Streptomyces wuyuanensis]|uniref:hypothetical protein n=1 Tax=Streptomyces wuyuanensis TaxID=1196353 RepID=UPI0034229443
MNERYSRTDFSPEAQAWRNVPHNPRPLCRDFAPKPEPSEFWCGTCGWNKPLHADERKRTAIAAELKRLAAVDDDICGDQYDDEVCDLEPGHDGHHCANVTVGWA